MKKTNNSPLRIANGRVLAVRNDSSFVIIKVIIHCSVCYCRRWICGKYAEEACTHEGGTGEERADALQQAGGGGVVDGRTAQHPDPHRHGGPAYLLHGHLSVLRRGSQ